MISIEERFEPLVDKSTPSGCWEWKGKFENGQPYFRGGGRTLACDTAYFIQNGYFSKDYRLEKICHNIKCVKPDHYRKVRIEKLSPDLCGKGLHEFTPENTIITKSGNRVCRKCHNEAQKIYEAGVREKNRQLRAENPPVKKVIVRPSKTHCKRGHLYTKENTYIRANGFRACVTCNREQTKKRYYEKKNASLFL